MIRFEESLISDMDAGEIIAVAEGMDLDDLADFYQSLPDKLQQEALQGMDKAKPPALGSHYLLPRRQCRRPHGSGRSHRPRQRYP